MNEADESRVETPSPGRPFQFSLRTMFILTTAVAVVCGGLSAQNDWIQMLTAFYFTVSAPMILLVILIYGRGYRRTFVIGAMFPAAASMLVTVCLVLVSITSGRVALPLGAYASDRTIVRGIMVAGTVVFVLMTLFGGLIAMGVRWMVESSQQPQLKPVSGDPPQSVRDSTASDLTLKPEDDAG